MTNVRRHVVQSILDDILKGDPRLLVQKTEIAIKNPLLKIGEEVGEYGNSLLLLASYQGREDVVGLLLKANAKPDLANDSGTTPLMAAVLKGHSAVVTLLLNYNANPHQENKKRETAHTLAVKKKHWNIVQLFVDHSINKVECNNRVAQKPKRQKCALM